MAMSGQEFFKRLSDRIRSGEDVVRKSLTGRVGSGRDTLVMVHLRSGHEVFKISRVGPGRVGSDRPVPIRPVNREKLW